ncbi:hypothetical protein PHAVU_004G036500 [Phaseolus vulgaris]|uniref:F-box domain-containing protein n=1 Tax=Phaseolus vulgaris TaxID=3885 RepID=V7C1Z2_PHAVU|nr:hypothetical protein PHAVU_004G036500g [Phaseolus vulgaris]ESW23315.1 hypothetical protein PHAVU_004G036500g [Phaseolus vulgaris]
MADIVSGFPDSILCYILSFLPTKQVVATSVLSKRWNLLWRSVPSFDYEHHDPTGDYEDDLDACSDFLYSMFSHLLLRDMDKPLHRLRLTCCSGYNHYSIEIWIEAALRRSSRLEHLDLNVYKDFVVPSVVFSCITLVVLKLANLVLKDVSFADFPFLKILHLNSISFSGCQDLFKQFLSGSPNLEDLEAKNLDSNPAEKVNRLPKLVRANIDAHIVPLENVKNVQVLVTNGKQNLVAEDDEEAILPCPDPVPACILLHLTCCCLTNYSGSAFEFKFAEYIMQNANYLQFFAFRIYRNNPSRRDDMIRDLSSCKKISDTCKLEFV